MSYNRTVRTICCRTNYICNGSRSVQTTIPNPRDPAEEDRLSSLPLTALSTRRMRRSSLPLNTRPETRRPSSGPGKELPPPRPLARHCDLPHPGVSEEGFKLRTGAQDGLVDSLPGLGLSQRQHRRKLSAPSPRLCQVPESRDDGSDGVGGAGDAVVKRVVRVRRYHSLQVLAQL